MAMISFMIYLEKDSTFVHSNSQTTLKENGIELSKMQPSMTLCSKKSIETLFTQTGQTSTESLSRKGRMYWTAIMSHTLQTTITRIFAAKSFALPMNN